jgi:hypothetical protein
MNDFLVVDFMSDDIFSFFDTGRINKNHCYSNVFYINHNIFSKDRIAGCDNSYVLCYADGEPHCILKYNGVYYDPTLQIHDRINDKRYILVKEFSYNELYKFMKNNNGFGLDGDREYAIPPRLTRDGKITCSECDVP